VYTLRSTSEIEALLAESGFAPTRSTEHAIGKGRFAFTLAQLPLGRCRPGPSSFVV
jgi:hypothetical protein